MELIKNMLVLILCCFIITTNLIPESKQTVDIFEETFDAKFLQRLNSVIGDIKKWVFQEYSKEIRVISLDEDDIWLLSSPYNIDPLSGPKKKLVLQSLKEMFVSLECFHSLLTFNLFRIIKINYVRKQNNPGERISITLWDFYKYVHRMQAVFLYGKFNVQQWQSDVHSRLKELENIESLDDFVSDIKLKEDKDEKLIITMTEFGYQCQQKHYLPQSECINNVLRTQFLTLTYFNWLSCKMNVPCVRSLEGEVTRKCFRVPEEEMKEKKKLTFEDFKLRQKEMGFLESQTSDPNKFDENKNEFKLNAFDFGLVCKPESQRTPSIKMKIILLAEYNETRAMRYEKMYKRMGITTFEKETKLKVMPCGEFVDNEFSFLAARPDGLIGDDGIIIVKCPKNAKHVSPKTFTKLNQFQFLSYINTTKCIILKRNSEYYYQVQGQLHITQKEYCYFVVWNPSGLFYEKITRDDVFWKNEMEKKLDSFYKDHLLPEFVDPQYVSTYNRYVIRK